MTLFLEKKDRFVCEADTENYRNADSTSVNLIQTIVLCGQTAIIEFKVNMCIAICSNCFDV